ncbi:hypothetical protein ABZ686_04610 [Streptomyces sp. NPDC006992]|uniref:hypothetical protein n=1 Tax=Streptomyces sp. NPDC006992 TaxID=3155601 RepID=UPI0033E464B1
MENYLLGAGIPCTAMSSDQNDDRLPTEGFRDEDLDSDDPGAQYDPAWGVEERGVCGGDWDAAFVIYRTKDMKAFQEQYRDEIRQREKEKHRGDSTSLKTGTFLVGENFVVDPNGSMAKSGPLNTKLQVLNCDPDLQVPSGYKKQDALADGCVLTNYVGG